MKIQNKVQILKFIKDNREVIRKYKVKRLGLFGSFVRNEQKAQSDVDFLVEYEKGEKTLDNFLGLIDYLESSFDREVELVTLESLSEYIKPYIDQEVEYVQIND